MCMCNRKHACMHACVHMHVRTCACMHAYENVIKLSGKNVKLFIQKLNNKETN